MSSTRLINFSEFERRALEAGDDRPLPRDLDAESAILGAVLIQNEALEQVALTPNHFFRRANALIFASMLALRKSGTPVDPITLKDDLGRSGDLDRVGGPAYIARLTDGVPRSVNVAHYVNIVREHAVRRFVIEKTTVIAKGAYDLAQPTAAIATALRAIDEAVNQAHVATEGVSEPLSILLDRLTDAAPSFLVDELIPEDGTILLHSQPREFKSLVALSICLSVSTGLPAFGLSRLKVRSCHPVWYITEEDRDARVGDRLRQLVRGVGLDQAPNNFHLSAGRGISLDDPDWQERVIAEAQQLQSKLVVLDPLRSLTATADQGPRELKPFVMFLRHFMRETGAVVLIVHHDSKPGAFGKDNRRRPQRASGGGIFSIADAPIHVERLHDGTRLLVPNDFKFTADPPRVLLRLEQGPGWLRLAGEDRPSGRGLGSLDPLPDRILRYLLKRPNVTSTEVVRGIKAAKAAVLRDLKDLEAAGRVASVADGKAIRWHALSEHDGVGSVSSRLVPEPENR